MNNLKIETVKITDLKPHPKNPRIHPESGIEKLVKSIKEFGWTNPILASRDKYILAGHARLKAAQRAGLKEVPVIFLPLDGAKALAYLIADNRLQEETTWDNDLLAELVNELKNFDYDLELTGFDLEESNEIINGFTDEVDTGIKELKLKPFNKVHWLISIDLENMEGLEKMNQMMESLKEITGVEIEQSSN